MPNPFDDFSFDSGMQAGNVSNDDIARVLLDTTPKTPFQNVQVQGGTSEGISRVNKNTAETGTVAYRDSKGQAVLTNVARDPISNQEKPIAALFKAPTPVPSVTTPTTTGTPTDILTAVQKLQKTQDVAEAQALHQSIVASLTEQDANITREAFKFAENKLGIPQIMKNLEQARQADKSDPSWYPGIGDSPITQKINNELMQARQFADNEAKNYLVQHAGYKSLTSLRNTVDTEIKRIQTLQDRKEVAEFNKKLTTDEINARQTAETERKLLDAYEGLSTTQLANIEILNAGDLAAFKDIGDDTKRKIKTMQLVLNKGKDKSFQEAVNAEAPQQLFGLAVAGNKYARKLVVAKEANTLGIPQNEVEAQLVALERKANDPKFIQEVLQARVRDPKQVKALVTEFAMAKFDPNKKVEMDNRRISLVQEYAENAKTAMFSNDVRSWGSIDPLMIDAASRSAKITGKADVSNVLAAYVGDATGPERLAKINDFKKHLQVAVDKHKNSAFGTPRYRDIEAQIIQSTVSQGWFSKALANIKPNDVLIPGTPFSFSQVGQVTEKSAQAAKNFFVGE